jgi:hypothetical protein
MGIIVKRLTRVSPMLRLVIHTPNVYILVRVCSLVNVTKGLKGPAQHVERLMVVIRIHVVDMPPANVVDLVNILARVTRVIKDLVKNVVK